MESMFPYQRLLLLEQKICLLLCSVITLSKGSLGVSSKTEKRGQSLYKRNLMRYAAKIVHDINFTCKTIYGFGLLKACTCIFRLSSSIIDLFLSNIVVLIVVNLYVDCLMDT